MVDKEIDWKKAINIAAVGDIADLVLGILPLGKFVGDAIDVMYNLPQMRTSLPDVNKDMAYLTALAEVLPFIELLPNWGLLTGVSYINKEVLGGGGLPAQAGLFGLPERGAGLKLGTARTGEARGRGAPLTEEERRVRHKTIFGELGLPSPEELLLPLKNKK